MSPGDPQDKNLTMGTSGIIQLTLESLRIHPQQEVYPTNDVPRPKIMFLTIWDLYITYLTVQDGFLIGGGKRPESGNRKKVVKNFKKNF